MLTLKLLKISTDALLGFGVSGAGVCIRRGAPVLLSRLYMCSLSGNVDRDDDGGCVGSERYERDWSVGPVKLVGGDVGDGIFGE